MEFTQQITIHLQDPTQEIFFTDDLTVQKRGAWGGGMIIDWDWLFKALFFATKNKQSVVTYLVDEITALLIIDSILHMG